jgi:putative SOS response-associated peptidase YedK
MMVHKVKKTPDPLVFSINGNWGLVPSWAKDPSIGNKLINAGGETVSEKTRGRFARIAGIFSH